MPDPDSLHIWFEDRLVGSLWRRPASAIRFRYEPAWIESGGFPISCSLPLAADGIASADGTAHRFFANLLPEGTAREQLVRDRKIPNTDFDLLRAFGGECAGALSILPAERSPADDSDYRSLQEHELARLIAQRGRIRAVLPEHVRPRLSLAGAQDKLPVLFRDGLYSLPQGEAPTSHVLKFEVPGYRHLPAYETFTSCLARQIGLPVIDIELASTGKHLYSRAERYDRLWDGHGKLRRLHQEDFCQALGYGHERKYQQDGGPTFAQCIELLRDVSSAPAIDVQHLLRWQIFNVLAGNSDGHAKNLSLLHLQSGEIRLAPFYDLVCTRAIARIDHRLAFAVGGQRDPGAITAKHWDSLAAECDIRPRFLRGLLEDASAFLLAQLNGTKALFEARHGKYPSLQRIEKVIRKQCDRVMPWRHPHPEKR